jgi:hypothetical protein
MDLFGPVVFYLCIQYCAILLRDFQLLSYRVQLGSYYQRKMHQPSSGGYYMQYPQHYHGLGYAESADAISLAAANEHDSEDAALRYLPARWLVGIHALAPWYPV